MGLFGPGSIQSVLLVCKLRLNPSSWVLTESLEKSPVVSLKVTVSIEFFPSLFFCSSQLLRLSPKKLQVDDLISPPPSVTSSLKPLSPHVHQMWPPLPAEVLCHISQQSVLQQIQLVLFLYFSFFSCFVANVQKQRMHHQMRCKYNLMEYECYQAQHTLQKCSEPPRIKKVFEFQLLLYYYY